VVEAIKEGCPVVTTPVAGHPPGVHAELMRYPAVTILTTALSILSLK
jgi:hypothetical protein